MKLAFNKNYLALAILLFIVEVLIALFLNDRFIRPYLGDVLVVMLIYCSVKSILHAPVLPLVIGVLMFSFTIEFLQYVNIVEMIGLEKSAIARTVIGTSFVWMDLVCYVSGCAIILAVEKYLLKKTSDE